MDQETLDEIRQEKLEEWQQDYLWEEYLDRQRSEEEDGSEFRTGDFLQ